MKKKIILAVFLAASVFAAAQTTNGIPPFASIGGGRFDHLDLANLNGQFLIPVTAKAGRRMPFSYALSYNNSIWFPASNGTSTSWQPVANYGWQAQTDAAYGLILKQTLSEKCRITNPDGTLGWSFWTMAVFSGYQDPGGAFHSMPVSTTTGSTDCGVDPVSAGTTSATDGSGYTLSVTNYSHPIVQARSGAVINAPSISTAAGSLNDSNGNILSTSVSGNTTTFTDTLGATALTITGTPPGNVTYTFTNNSGTNSTVTVTYTSYTIQTSFGCAGINEYSATGNLVTNIALPDGSQYQFSYEPTPGTPTSTTGRIASMILPTGGIISYTYTGGSNGINCSDGSIAGLTRTANPTSTANEGSWTYTRSLNPPYTSTTVKDPAGNQTVIQFQGIYETQRDIYSGNTQTGTLLQTAYTCYNGAAYPCTTTAASLPISRITVTTNKNGYYRQTDVTYNSAGLPLAAKEYDFSSGAPGGLLRETDLIYASITGIQDRPSDILVKDATGTRFAETLIYYDQSSITGTSSAPSHDYTNYGSSFTSRGDPTTISRWVSGTTWINTTSTYNDLGDVLTTTDAARRVTTFDYTDNYNDNTNRSTQAFVTKVTYPQTYNPLLGGYFNHIVKRSYYWPSALLYQTTDQNGQVTTYNYDNSLRPASVTYPDTGQTTYSYPNPQQVEIQKKIDGAHPSDSWVEVDGLGRTSRSATANGETSPYDQVDTCYDPVNQKVTTTYAYQGSGIASGTNGEQCSKAGDVTAYDALARPVSVTHSDGSSTATSYSGRAVKVQDEGNGSGTQVAHVYQVDGLGRSTSVCEEANSIFGTTVANCGLDIDGSVKGVTTGYSYDARGHVITITQGALTNRQFTYDGLSHLLSEYIPETKGTTTYTYNSLGLLATRSRYSANQPASCIGPPNTCTTTTASYSYDELNRLRTVSYSSNDTTTPYLVYFYDQQSPYGLTTSTYSIGRMVAAWTENHNWTGIQGALFGYDQLGRENIEGETLINVCCSPNYILNYGYDLAGRMASSTNAEGVTFNYSYNLAGRPTQMTSSMADANHPGTLFSQAHYNAGGELLSDSLGNSVNQSFSYDAQWRMLSETATNGGTSVYTLGGPGANNTMTYAPNSGITGANDSVNGNWSYSYDPLSRIAGASQSGGANLTFDTDRNGNRWHQNPNGAQLGFDTSSNQIASGSGVTYDALGNIINDGVHSYTYDAENRLTQVDGGTTATYTYDALGRRTRRAVGSGTYDDIYDLNGNMITEAGSGHWYRGEVYLGGHLATYWNATTYFSLTDWLGSERVRTDVNGNVAGTCTGNPYGDNYSCTGTDPSPVKYAGMEYDSETQLYHTRFRYYNPRWGLWMNPDPAGSGAASISDPQSFNRFSYVEHNPMGFIDPFGLFTINVPAPAGAGGGDDLNKELIEIGTCGTFGAICDNWNAPVSSPDGGGSAGNGFANTPNCLPPGTAGPPAPNCRPYPIVPAPPCDQAGGAMDPSVYARAGDAASTNDALDDVYLLQFAAGKKLDAQRYGASPEYANYVFGVYMSAAGYTLAQALTAADIYAQYFGSYSKDKPKDPQYNYTPEVNVMNITYGFDAQKNGTLCHTQVGVPSK